MDIGIFGIYKELGMAGAVAYLFWCIASITLHELAHGWAALWQGDDTPRTYGRMTWNPVVHMGFFSLLCLALVGIAWGMMPTDPSKYRWGRQGRIVVSGAGPAMNIVLFLLCWAVVGVVKGLGLDPAGQDDSIWQRIVDFAVIGGLLNGMLALFNLLPLPPFDGASIVAGFSRTYYRWMHDPRVQNVGFFIVLVAMFSGIAGLCAKASATAGVLFSGAIEAGLRSVTG
jgi:Zn-dependent protease